jgi:hypothetical protein
MLSLSRFPEISPWPGESTRKMRGLQGRLAPVVNFGGIHARFARGADEGVRPYTSELYRETGGGRPIASPIASLLALFDEGVWVLEFVPIRSITIPDLDQDVTAIHDSEFEH